MPLDPPEEAVDDDLEPGLLERLADDGLVQGLAPLDAATGHRPLPRRRSPPPPHEEERVGVHAHRADRDLGPVHAQPFASRRRCITSARAVNPWVSKKFLVAR